MGCKQKPLLINELENKASNTLWKIKSPNDLGIKILVNNLDCSFILHTFAVMFEKDMLNAIL